MSKINVKKLKAAIPIDEFYQSELGPPAKTNSNNWTYLCPFHNDANTPNLVVYHDGGFKCFACDAKGGDVLAFHQKREGLSFTETLTSLAKEYAPELMPSNGKGQYQRIVAEFPYQDESGKLLYQTVRYGPKKNFKYRRPDGNGGWIWDLRGVERVPYRLPELLKAEGCVYIPGGEKDCETLVGHGFQATTNACGEGQWLPEFNQYLKGLDVVILEDHDDKGENHGKVVSQNLHWVARSVKIIRFPELPNHGDISDFLENHKLEEFLKLVKEAPVFKGDYPAYFNECPPFKLTAPSDKPDQNDDEKEKPTQSQILISLARDCELFHNSESETFASVTIDGHEETWPIRSRGFKLWLLSRFYQQQAKAPGAQAQADAMGVLEAQAQFGGPEHPVYVRIAGHEGNIYLNLGDDQCRVVEVTPDGWEIITNSPVKFVHPKGCLPLPVPETGGSIDDLRRFVNIEDEDGWKLFIATLIAAFKPTGPYPVTVLQGEQGSSKSTAMRLKRSLIDPNVAALRTSPRESRDLMIYAKNSWLLSFDNLSKIPDWLADSFCRLATGGGFSTRELYSNNEENIISATRIIDLNGIEEIITRDDLLDRCVFIRLPSISESKRKDEESFWAEFHEAQPRILGGLLDAVSIALKNHPHVKLESKPRMADFARWVVAAEPGLGWEPGSFLKAYASNRASAVQMGLEASAVAQAIETITETVPEWQGTATELLDQLDKVVSEKIFKMKEWPKTPQSLSNKLRRLAPTMRSIGREISFEREGHTGKRFIQIRNRMQKTVTPVTCVTQNHNSNKHNHLAGDSTGDDVKPGDDAGDGANSSLSPSKLFKNNGGDDGDKGDDDLRLFPNLSDDGFLEGSV